MSVLLILDNFYDELYYVEVLQMRIGHLAMDDELNSCRQRDKIFDEF